MGNQKKPLDGLSLSSFAQPQQLYLDKKPVQHAATESVSTAESAAAEPSLTPSLLPEQDDLMEGGWKAKQVAVNVKILKHQQDWLRDTAQSIRDNNDMAVPACDRVYPQHLIQVAIDMLKAANVDWTEIRNAEELRGQLKL
ncbi:MAG: hypothetical protein ACFB4J_11900 [Elainellaceae cyanobacterium]